MQNRNRPTTTLQIKSSTWQKDSHSLYDYQSQKIESALFTFPVSSRTVSIYRKRGFSNVIAIDQKSESNKFDLDDYQFLTRFQIRSDPKLSKLKLEFDKQRTPKLKKMSSQRLNTDESNSACESKQQGTYMVVRKLKDSNNQQQGFRLTPGCTMKLGRVQYFVCESKQNDIITKAKNQVNNFNNKIFKVQPQISSPQNPCPKNACKICLDQVETPQNFLFNPCHCTGSCGTVHIDCLTQWIHVKVKKQTIGGTIHFNFNKFQCQICKYQLPMIIQTNNGQRQLLPIQKPKGNYLILQGACQKTKSVMVIQNVPAQGIKLGRGHECQIRITDISVSRNHAYIKNIGNGFYLFDCKSKFGTLVKTESLVMQLGKIPRAIQIGRTVLNFQLNKQKQSRLRPIQ